MARSNDHKARKAKARQEAIRKQKATVTAQPRLFRQQPGLAEALSTRHPLIGYFVNDNWAEARIASIYVIREAPSGEVFANFLVDLLLDGTKDVFGRYEEVDVLGQALRRLRSRDPERSLVPLATEAAVNLIRGGVAWARQGQRPLPDDLDIWLRLVDPAPAWGLDLGMFGIGGERPGLADMEGSAARYAGIQPGDLEDDEDAGVGDEMPVEAAAPGTSGPGGLWLPGDDLWRPEAPAAAAPPIIDERPTPSGLWVPGGWRGDDDHGG